MPRVHGARVANRHKDALIQALELPYQRLPSETQALQEIAHDIPRLLCLSQ
ncbi:hypothetical protein [Myxacorys almedinensis]|uniref:Uncharacterized protein n=1 Tax=Myxacorys almedinensis A TaxID=2690445 RepID=A0A8J8CKK0_9CYAN|nr:hypothetical protein [Myxacorys almedinensis]NDJ16730.1 hypothetical protein [Myxacorys almedinensis A]